MAFDNVLNTSLDPNNKDSFRTAKRKLLSLVRNENGELFHVIHYLKKDYTLYKASKLVFDCLREKSMDVIAIVNLDTGGFDILNTAGDATNCNGNNVWGSTSNYDDMTNVLTYEYD